MARYRRVLAGGNIFTLRPLGTDHKCRSALRRPYFKHVICSREHNLLNYRSLAGTTFTHQQELKAFTLRAFEVLIILLHSPLFSPHRVTHFRKLCQKEYLIPLQLSSSDFTSRFVDWSFFKSLHAVPDIITRPLPRVLGGEGRLRLICSSGLQDRQFNLFETSLKSCAATEYIKMSLSSVTARATYVSMSSRKSDGPSSSSVASCRFLNCARCSRIQSWQ